MKTPLLTLEDLKCYFPVEKGIFKTKDFVKALDGINLDIYKGETFGLVGESGSGKSTLARVVSGLEKATAGRVIFDEEDITPTKGRPKALSIKDIQLVFQDPYSSLNPRMTIGEIIEEPLLIQGWNKKKRQAEAKILLELVGLSPKITERYPHELSGGQRQRSAIARALSLRPKFIICDESVSALDVSIQAQILNLLDELQEDFDLTYLFIAHNLGVVRHMSDRIGVMYLGEIVETGETEKIYNEPLHPYTKALISVIPSVIEEEERERIVLSGEIPSPTDVPEGCRFHTRCPFRMDICQEVRPKIQQNKDGRFIACHLYSENYVKVE